MVKRASEKVKLDIKKSSKIRRPQKPTDSFFRSSILAKGICNHLEEHYYYCYILHIKMFR